MLSKLSILSPQPTREPPCRINPRATSRINLDRIRASPGETKWVTDEMRA